MFSSKTLFVAGAGASCEVGLPAGGELKSHIAQHLNIRFDGPARQVSGNLNITEALRIFVRQTKTKTSDINPHLHSAWTIRDAAPLSISIDNYIEAHQGDPKIELCGKLGIVQSILEAERRSRLFVKYPEQLEQTKLANTWYSAFFQLLTENVRKSEISSLFNNVSFIAFNYDRCIEHYLAESIRSYYSVSENDSRELVQALQICHPYGVVGDLRWQSNDGIAFGEEVNGKKLLELSSKIQTFTERAEEETAISRIRKQIEEAETIVFFGFAFHPLNMKLIRPENPSAANRVFLTNYQISESDQQQIETDIISTLQKEARQISIMTRKNMTCAQLFKEYWRILSRGR